MRCTREISPDSCSTGKAEPLVCGVELKRYTLDGNVGWDVEDGHRLMRALDHARGLDDRGIDSLGNAAGRNLCRGDKARGDL